METKLRYGKGELTLNQSDRLIGVRPKPNRSSEEVARAVDQAFGGDSWGESGLLGGFRIIDVGERTDIDVDDALDAIRRDNAVAIGTHVFESPAGRGFYVPTGELYVEFKPDASSEERQEVLDRYRLAIKESRGANSFVAAVTRESLNPIKTAYALQQERSVSVAEPDLASRATLKSFVLPTDGLLSEQWHLRNTGFHRSTSLGFKAGADARVIDAWEAGKTFGKPDIIIAVIDDGFDLAHPDFAIPGKVVHPWDFSRTSSNPTPGNGDWHGTACAGVAAAAAGAGNVVGAAPGCTIMPVRWGPDLSDGQVEAWFEYVTVKGAAVVSCSWGAANPYFPLSTRAYRAIEHCARTGRGGRGCVVVFAAGNDDRNINNPDGGTVDGFAIHPDVIAVAACTSRDMRSDYSNYGAEISVCAPSNGAGGWGILTSDVTGIHPVSGLTLGYEEGDYTYEFGGTSSACPLVAGIAALILSVAPNLTSGEVKEILQGTARRIGDPEQDDDRGHSLHFGFGCVNAADAVRAARERNGV